MRTACPFGINPKNSRHVWQEHCDTYTHHRELVAFRSTKHPRCDCGETPDLSSCLEVSGRAGHHHVCLPGTSAVRRRESGQTAQGSVTPGLLRDPWGRLRRRVPSLPDCPRDRPDPGSVSYTHLTLPTIYSV